MNGRRLHLEYLKSLGEDAQEFVRIEDDWYGVKDVYFKESTGREKKRSITYTPMVHWMIRKCKINLKQENK